MIKSKIVFFVLLSALGTAPQIHAAACAKGEPPCSDCQPVPYDTGCTTGNGSCCAVNNCCADGSGGTVSRACVCTEVNSSGVCTSCASN